MRLNNQQTFDEEVIATTIEGGNTAPVIQFSVQAAYDESVLSRVNSLCRRFGSQIHVRFYGHNRGQFDCRWLRHVPEVRSLGMDCLMHAGNVDELNRLTHLEELTFGVFEADLPQLLETPSLSELRKLILVDTRKNNIDLAPLATFRRLATLTVCGHARHIEALTHCGTIRRLALNQMRKSVSFDFVRSMGSLRSLSIMLGGRANLDEVAHENLERLEVMRVRGLERVELKGVPALTWLHLEDQLQMETLDLEPTRTQLRVLKIFNCKQLSGLQGIQLLDALESLWLGRTAIDPEKLMALLPKALRAVSLSGYGTRRDAMLTERLRSLGYDKAPYMEESC